jgi:hypothetical protein
VYKKGERCEADNYRPISLLPAFSKIYEKVLNKRLLAFLTRYGIILPNQFGFVPTRCTSDAIFRALSTVYQRVESSHVLGVFFDLSKAFDVINHDILSQKMERYGIRGLVLNLFRSYLGDRSYRTCVKGERNNVTSEHLSPQR